MNFASCRRCVALFLYCVAVNGQPTTDSENNEISKVLDIVAELRAELAEVKKPVGCLS